MVSFYNIQNELFGRYLQWIEQIRPRFNFIDNENNQIYHFYEINFEIKYDPTQHIVTFLFSFGTYVYLDHYFLGSGFAHAFGRFVDNERNFFQRTNTERNNYCRSRGG